jgi:branched-chain amino acid transport system ATP-binding protein
VIVARDSTASGWVALEARGIGVRFGALRAVDEVSLTLNQGEILGLIGPNGSGKTTFINAVTGHLPVAAGDVYVGPTRLTRMPAHKIPRTGVARTFQVVRLFKRLTVLENVEVAAVSVSNLDRRRARVRAWQGLERMGLVDRADQLAGTLPYGDQRLLEIARSLATQPRFLLLDEPGAGLNETEIESLLGRLESLPRDLGCGILIVDHDMRLIMGLSDRIHVLDHGRTIAEGLPSEVRAVPAVREAYLGSAASTDV